MRSDAVVPCATDGEVVLLSRLGLRDVPFDKHTRRERKTAQRVLLNTRGGHGGLLCERRFRWIPRRRRRAEYEARNTICTLPLRHPPPGAIRHGRSKGHEPGPQVAELLN